MTDPVTPAADAGGGLPSKRQPNRWNARRRQIFIDALMVSANVNFSARKAGMSFGSAYKLKARDPAFAQAWREALEVGFSEVEMALIRQSVEGSERTETVRDGKDGTIRYVKTVRSSSACAAVMLRLLLAHRAEVMAWRAMREGMEPEGDAREEVRVWLEEIETRLIESEQAQAEEAAQAARHGKA